MATWKYTMGSESDFEGAPDWAMFIISSAFNNTYAVASIDPETIQHIHNVSRDGGPRERWLDGTGNLGRYIGDEVKVIAQREPVESSSWVYHLGTPEMFARMSEGVTHLFRSKQTSVVRGFNWTEVCCWDFYDDYELIGQREPVESSHPNPVHDNINHPLRYTKGDVECIDAIKAATVGKTGIEAVDVGHVIRYLWRYEEKDGLESVKKAQWYIEHLIKQLETKQ